MINKSVMLVAFKKWAAGPSGWDIGFSNSEFLSAFEAGAEWQASYQQPAPSAAGEPRAYLWTYRDGRCSLRFDAEQRDWNNGDVPQTSQPLYLHPPRPDEAGVREALERMMLAIYMHVPDTVLAPVVEAYDNLAKALSAHTKEASKVVASQGGSKGGE